MAQRIYFITTNTNSQFASIYNYLGRSLIGTNGGEEDTRKTENDVVGLDDGGRLQQTEGKSQKMR